MTSKEINSTEEAGSPEVKVGVNVKDVLLKVDVKTKLTSSLIIVGGHWGFHAGKSHQRCAWEWTKKDRNGCKRVRKQLLRAWPTIDIPTRFRQGCEAMEIRHSKLWRKYNISCLC